MRCQVNLCSISIQTLKPLIFKNDMGGISHLTLSRCLLLACARAILVDDDKTPLNMVGFVVNVVLRCRRCSHLLHGLLLLLLAALAGEALP